MSQIKHNSSNQSEQNLTESAFESCPLADLAEHEN